jgi:ATP-dependent helicase IRC3
MLAILKSQLRYRFCLFYRPRFSSSNALSLRDYQEDCIDACVKALVDENIRRQAVCLPVGSGKTVVFSKLISRIPNLDSGATKTLILAHREELIIQARNQILKMYPNIKLGIEKSNIQGDPINDQVILASVQSLGRVVDAESGGMSKRITKYDPMEFKCIIIDEAHHAVAKTYKTILDYFGVLKPQSRIFLWGCSATLIRLDQKALGSVFERITFVKTFDEMVMKKWLCQPRIVEIHAGMSQDADKDEPSLLLGLNTSNRNRLLVETWIQLARNVSEPRIQHYCKSTIVFATNVDHVNELVKVFGEYIGTSLVAGITTETPVHERSRLLDQFRQGELHVLVNCSIMTEGTDLPMIDCILVARPTKSPSLFVQMVGRGLRLSPGKQSCLVILAGTRKDRLSPRSMHIIPTLEGHDAIRRSAHSSTLMSEHLHLAPKDICRETVSIMLEEHVLPASGVNGSSDQSHIRMSLPDLAFHHLDWIYVSPILYITHNLILTINYSTGSLALDKIESNLYSWDSNTPESSNLIISGPLSKVLDAAFRYCLKSKTLSLAKRQSLWKRQQIQASQKFAIKKIPCMETYNGIYRWTSGIASRVITKYTFLKNYLGAIDLPEDHETESKSNKIQINRSILLQGTL